MYCIESLYTFSVFQIPEFFIVCFLFVVCGGFIFEFNRYFASRKNELRGMTLRHDTFSPFSNFNRTTFLNSKINIIFLFQIFFWQTWRFLDTNFELNIVFDFDLCAFYVKKTFIILNFAKPFQEILLTGVIDPSRDRCYKRFYAPSLGC